MPRLVLSALDGSSSRLVAVCLARAPSISAPAQLLACFSSLSHAWLLLNNWPSLPTTSGSLLLSCLRSFRIASFLSCPPTFALWSRCRNANLEILKKLGLRPVSIESCRSRSAASTPHRIDGTRITQPHQRFEGKNHGPRVLTRYCSR